MSGWRNIPVVKRLYPAARKALARLTWTGGYKIVSYDGLLLALNHRNYVDRQIALFGGFEREQMACMLDTMKQGCDLFLDVGANFGLYALRVAKSGLAKSVHAFEPDPRNHAQLSGHMFLNKLTGKIALHRLAVSDKAGMLAFDLYDETSTGQSRAAAHGASQLEAVTLDGMFPVSNQRIFIKIDIEGHELAALHGAENLLHNNACFVQVECFPENAEAAAAFFARLGYKNTRRIEHDYFFSNT
jgi:FkbM family methyltransferase